MAAPPAIDPREGLRPLFERAGIDDNFYHRYKERLLDKGVGNAGDLLEEVALKGIASLGIHERQAEKLRQALLGRRGWEDAAAVLAASFGGLSLDDTPAGVAAGDQAASGAASAPALDGMAVDGGYASADEDAGPASGGPAAASGSKMEPGCSRSGAGTSAAAEGGEGAVTGGEGCSGTRTPEAESGAREARAAVVAGGVGSAVSVDTSDSAPLAEGGAGTSATMEVDAGSGEGAAAAGGRKAPRRRRGRRRGAKDHKGEFENVPDTEAANHGTTPPPAISGGSGGSAEAEPPRGPRPTYPCGVTITSATTAQVSSPSSSWPCGPDSELLPFELTEYARLYKLQNEMHVAAQEEEEDTEEEMDEEERAFREERARTLRGEAPTMTLQEFSDLDQRVFARVSARAAQPAPLQGVPGWAS